MGLLIIFIAIFNVMRPQTLLLTSSYLLILLQTCAGKCTPSACGVIRNISFPFRLKHDPKRCGDYRFELACENDVASLTLNSQKYYVKEINYLNSSIRLVDASIDIHNVCSFPNHSLYNYNCRHLYDEVQVYYPHRQSIILSTSFVDAAWPINLMSCQRPLKNFTDFTHCHPGFSYIKVGHMNAPEVPQSCELRFRLDCVLCAKLGFLFDLLILAILGVVSAGISPALLSMVGFVAALVVIKDAINLLPTMSNPVSTNSYFPVLPLIQPAIVFITLVPRIIFFPLVLCLLINKYRTRHLSMYNTIESFLQSDNKLVPIRYSYSQIKRMTRGFQDKLGEGGFGSVYKGKLRSGHDVAVKLLRKSRANGKDFITEIATIGRVHHVNIVKLVGYCAQGSKRALVFDFMSNGSLEKYIFNGQMMKSLNLDTKFEIAVGVAHGIQYLHQGCDVQILHFDIKPHNILLDDKFIPKISDFGLAKSCSTDKTAVTMTAARGTIGYVAPELINRSIGAVSYNVYSFGMLLMEMVGLRRDQVGNNDDSEQYFPDWIYDYLEQGQNIGIEAVDENCDDSMRRLVQKMVIVALWCIQMSPEDRPPMNKVLEMLEGNVECLQVPSHPFKTSHVAVNVDDSGSGTAHFTDVAPLLISHHGGSSRFEITVEERQNHISCN